MVMGMGALEMTAREKFKVDDWVKLTDEGRSALTYRDCDMARIEGFCRMEPNKVRVVLFGQVRIKTLSIKFLEVISK